MKLTLSRLTILVLALNIAAALSACGAQRGAMHQKHGPHTGGLAGSGAAAGPINQDMQSMCDQHRKMMQAHSPEERAAMMNERMQAMPAEARQKHMDMMHEHCK